MQIIPLLSQFGRVYLLTLADIKKAIRQYVQNETNCHSSGMIEFEYDIDSKVKGALIRDCQEEGLDDER